jgi:general secretion pathway protein E
METELRATINHEALTPEYLEHNGVLPLSLVDGVLTIATWRSSVDEAVEDDLRLLFGGEPDYVAFGRDDVVGAIQRHYGDGPGTAESLISGLESGPVRSATPSRTQDLRLLANEPPVIRLVGLLLAEALEQRASDVHLERTPLGLRVRYRVDGVLTGGPSPPESLADAVVSRLKVMAELDVAERRRPQDGRCRLRVDGRTVDVRVSTMPTVVGESVVLRLLDQQVEGWALEGLGMDPGTLSRLEALLAHPHGVLLATGPTGSGKTTTLYAALRRLSTGAEKVITVEDPVEYDLEGVAQVPVNRKSGLTFPAALRSILRQDPDILLVGEMRDPETAEICIQAALTGHLVLSTLHTNDAVGALIRLLDLKVEPYLISSTVIGVVAQRLVRVPCSRCAEDRPVPGPVSSEARSFGIRVSRYREGRGCPACRGTGYRGRTGIYELLEVDDEIRNEVLRRRGSEPLRGLARSSGMRTLRGDGWRQVAVGGTTPAELLRVTSGSHDERPSSYEPTDPR